MSDAPDPRAGLCAICAHCHRVSSTRGSTFYLCTRAEREAGYMRYPRLPVLRCDGFEVRHAGDDDSQS
jgi:hypothetical protein